MGLMAVTNGPNSSVPVPALIAAMRLDQRPIPNLKTAGTERKLGKSAGRVKFTRRHSRLGDWRAAEAPEAIIDTAERGTRVASKKVKIFIKFERVFSDERIIAPILYLN